MPSFEFLVIYSDFVLKWIRNFSKEKTGPGVGHILVHFEARDINPSVL